MGLMNTIPGDRVEWMWGFKIYYVGLEHLDVNFMTQTGVSTRELIKEGELY